MAGIELVPDKEHCIETVAKKELTATMRRLLSEEKDDALEEKAEILRSFLQTADFRRLRARYEPYLQRGERVTFTVYLKSGTVKYDIIVGAHPDR